MSPAILGSDIVAVVPLQSWFAVGNDVDMLSTTNAGNFDAMCEWPAEVGDPTDAHNSVSAHAAEVSSSHRSTSPVARRQGHKRISDFFYDLNESVLGGSSKFQEYPVISFSHFVPNEELCKDAPPELIPVLCGLRIADQVGSKIIRRELAIL